MALSKHGNTVHSFSSVLRVEQLLQDLRYSLRMVRRNPTFATIVTLTLALGIGMTTAMFSVVNGVLIEPLPYPHADQLVWIAPAAPTYENEVSRADYLLWKNQAHLFEAFTAYAKEERSLVYQEKASTVQFAFITGDFWNISGAKPVIGRLFGEHQRDELVLSWALFQDRFGGDPRVLEKIVTIDGRAFTVVGVLPRSFRFFFPPDKFPGDPIPDIEAYIPIPDGHEAPGDPIRETVETGPVPAWVRVVGRLKPDASFTEARAQMQVIYDRVRQIPSVFSRWPDEKMRFIPLTERLVRAPRVALRLLFGAVAFVLLIAGANFANLLMAGASTRAQEIAVRSALGASRGHLIRQFLMESISLAMLGGAMVGDVRHEHGKDAFAVRYASAGFFAAVRAPLIEGRWPTDKEWHDLKDLIVVNQTFARMYGGKSDILGQHIRGGVVDATVIGVVADFKDFQLDAPPEAEVYMAYPLAPGMITVRLFLRAERPKLLETTLSQLASTIDADVPIRVDTLEHALSESITVQRFNMYVFGVFAGSALLLALIGIYGVLSYLVKQRTREIGIRMALGAQQTAIMQMVVGQGMRIALAGMALGVVAALALTRLIASMLYETRATDPMTFVLVVLILAFMAILACWQPAFQAAKTDPVVALRDQ